VGAPHPCTSEAPNGAVEKRPGVLLDRDGTIIVDAGFVGSVDRVQLIPGAAEAIASFNAAGLPVAVLTNQSGVARGFFGTDDVERVHSYLAELLAESGAHVDLFLYCPYHPDGVVEEFARASNDRKPKPGMAIAAAEALELDLSRSWVIGDRPDDIGLAVAIGGRGVVVGQPRRDIEGVPWFADLAAAAGFILEAMGK